MRQSIFFLALLICSCGGASQSKKDQVELPNYPSFKEMSDKLFDAYDLEQLSREFQIKFEKHPDGWFIRLDKYEGNETKTAARELYWDAESETYQDLELSERNKYLGEKHQYEQARHYEFQDKKYLYFGYAGCHWDAIQTLKDKNDLTDGESFQLASAYGSFAHDMVGRYSNTVLPEHQFNLPDGKNAMTKEQLTKYRKYNRLGIQQLKKTRELNPDFETIVGSLDTKIANEYMDQFIIFWTHQNEKEALKNIPGDIYSEFMRNAARNYLTSCPKNAILITNGDNDTYPLLYLQAKENFRTDVTVVNFSLLQLPNYATGFKQGSPFGALPVATTIELDDIKGSKNLYWFFDHNVGQRLSLERLIKEARSSYNVKKFNGADYTMLPSKEFYLDWNDQRLEWKSRSQFLVRSTMLVYDIIVQNHRERPICFGINASRKTYCGLDEYLNLTGFVYVLQGEKPEEADYLREFRFPGYATSSPLFENLVRNCRWSLPEKQNDNTLSFVKTSKIQFTSLLNALMRDSLTSEARETLDLYLSTYGKLRSDADMLTVSIASHAYTLDMFDKGHEIAIEILEGELERYASKKPDQDKSILQRRALFVVDRLKSLAVQFNDEALLEKCEEAPAIIERQ